MNRGLNATLNASAAPTDLFSMRKLSSSFMYISYYLNKLFAYNWYPFVQNIHVHCIATYFIKGIQFSPRFSIFHFKLRSQINLFFSLLYLL